MSNVITLGTNDLVVNLDEMFPDLPEGNIYVALTGGVESTILLYLMQEFYSIDRLVACTYKFGDRRAWEFEKAKHVADKLNVKHVEAGYINDSSIMAESLDTSRKYFNRENLVFYNVRKNDPLFVAGFTGKNTTTLDPENITPEEQSKYLVWYSVHRPFLLMDKHHTVDLFYKLGAEALLTHTHSCQTNGTMHCGDCHACWERIDAFDRLGRKDPAIYKQDYNQLVEQVRKYFHQRWPHRAKEI